MCEDLKTLKSLLTEINSLNAAAAILEWDQMTYMPANSSEARSRQLAALERIAHEKFISPKIGQLLAALRPLLPELSPADAALVEITAHDYEKAVKIPPAFTALFSEHVTKTYEAWAKARAENNFNIVAPQLEKTLELSRQMANYFPGYQHIADPLIDDLDPGLTVATIRPLFAQLRAELAPLVAAITSQPKPDDRCLRQHYPEAEQLKFGLEVAQRLGFDFTRGRQDKSPHPFTTGFSVNDVRITTRINEDNVAEGLLSTIHETGHALYEQGINPDFDGTPLATGTTMSIHESQSRLWENLVGRSRHFWMFFYPRLQTTFPQQLKSVPFETFYRAMNRVEPSLIRTEADEVSYNLHVMIRFDLETQMLEGKLAVKDLPEAWNESYRRDLGIVPPDDCLGVLQDMHWFSGTIGGYFQSYTLGNILSAQFYDAAVKAHPNIPAEIAGGNFDSLRQWLQEHIYQYGRQYSAATIVQRATGYPMEIGPYVAYLRKKYGELYSL
jgi:carboxypeptidase Taq